MVETLGWEVRVEWLQSVEELVPLMHIAQVLLQMPLVRMVVLVVAQQKTRVFEMVDHRQLRRVQTELVMEVLEVKVAQVVELNLAAAAVVLAEQVVMLELAPVEMAATERMFSPLG
jgi:hypothetical protein